MFVATLILYYKYVSIWCSKRKVSYESTIILLGKVLSLALEDRAERYAGKKSFRLCKKNARRYKILLMDLFLLWIPGIV